MVAVVDIPGSPNHYSRYFKRSDKTAALAWIQSKIDGIQRNSPQYVPFWQIISDKKAATVKYRSGEHVYASELGLDW